MTLRVGSVQDAQAPTAAFFGFFVPNLLRLDIRVATPQIQSPPDKPISHTGTVLRSPAADEDDAVLLDVVAFARDVG